MSRETRMMKANRYLIPATDYLLLPNLYLLYAADQQTISSDRGRDADERTEN